MCWNRWRGPSATMSPARHQVDYPAGFIQRLARIELIGARLGSFKLRGGDLPLDRVNALASDRRGVRTGFR